jgi:hypothetical protein
MLEDTLGRACVGDTARSRMSLNLTITQVYLKEGYLELNETPKAWHYRLVHVPSLR